MNYYFTADTHLGHINILKYANRPFSTIQEMDEAIINNWNSIVKSNDIVYHLGDFCFKNKDAAQNYLRRLNGRINFINGNHDQALKQYKNQYWEKDISNKKRINFLGDLVNIEINNQMIVLCHYPLLTWPKKGYGSLMLHGHCHYNLKPTRKDGTQIGKILDVGVDGNNYKLYSFDELKIIIDKKPMFPAEHLFNDHHVNS